MRRNQRLMLMMEQTRGSDGKYKMAAKDIIGMTKYWTQSTPGVEVAGDGAANGTSICTLSITAEKYFICTHLMASTNIGAIILLGTGSLASMTKVYIIDLMNSGGFVAISEKVPIFTYDNTSSSSAVTLIMYAPKTAKNVATNNDTNHYFDGFIGGLLI